MASRAISTATAASGVRRHDLPDVRAAGPAEDPAAQPPGDARAAQPARSARADADEHDAGRPVLHLRAQDRAGRADRRLDRDGAGRRHAFRKTLKVETVMPNRLKIDLDLGDQRGPRQLSARRHGLSAQWLSGATAANLARQSRCALSPIATHFTRNADFVFDDPARSFSGAPLMLFEGDARRGRQARSFQRISS